MSLLCPLPHPQVDEDEGTDSCPPAIPGVQELRVYPPATDGAGGVVAECGWGGLRGHACVCQDASRCPQAVYPPGEYTVPSSDRTRYSCMRLVVWKMCKVARSHFTTHMDTRQNSDQFHNCKLTKDRFTCTCKDPGDDSTSPTYPITSCSPVRGE